MNDKNQNAGLFGLGEANTAYQQYFTGNSYLHGLVAAADEIDVTVANVTFEPSCRNNWHIHQNGSQAVKAGIRKPASQHNCCIPVMWSRFMKA